ncbi:glycoside hydrolase family 26 protein [Streptomyces beihaiensis]|uniref:Glycosyl hydrolase n=1 Tax=Streptomyces beihaiensis TaxID=2984495 RepID=A0ABT3TMG1_9ACTN|nr:glycosyl hydrolase [Streptomyces beihaiensis]MCX3058196.1 glycosyl hydrolase [Streptomyces beihaiensis]
MARSLRPGYLVSAALVVVVTLFAAFACGGKGADEQTGAPGTTGSTPEAAASAAAGSFDVSSMLRPSGRMLGVVDNKTPWQYGIVQTFTRQAGRAPDLREYYTTWGDDFDAEGNSFLWKHGQLPMVELVPSRTSLADIAGGSQDAYIRRLAAQITAYHGPLALSFAGEMNGPWNSWGPGHAKAADFVAAWRHLHDTFRSLGVTNVIWVWSPHVIDSGSRVALRPYFPGNDYVDWVGVIGYYGPIDGDAFSSLFTPTLRSIAAFCGKPVLITETAVAQSSTKQAQIQDLFKSAAEAGVIGLVWYDQRKTWPGGKQLMDWRIDTSVGARAAFRVESARAGFGHPFTGH